MTNKYSDKSLLRRLQYDLNKEKTKTNASNPPSMPAGEHSSETATPEFATVYPNPFNPTTTFRYNLTEAGEIELRIFNTLGQEIRLLEKGMKVSGEYEINWNGRNQNGVAVSSGVYFYRLTFRPSQANSRTITQSGSLTLVK